MQVLGTDELYNYLSKYGIELDPQLEGLVGRHARRPWNKFTNPENAHLVTPEGMDFLDNLLKYDHQVGHASAAAAAAVAAHQWYAATAATAAAAAAQWYAATAAAAVAVAAQCHAAAAASECHAATAAVLVLLWLPTGCCSCSVELDFAAVLTLS